MSGGLSFLQRRDQIDQGAVVNATPRCAAAMTRLIAKCVLPTPGGPSSTTFSLRSMKLSSWRLSICSLYPQPHAQAVRSFDDRPFMGLINASELMAANANRVYLEVERE
jgi:hypothetical protein